MTGRIVIHGNEDNNGQEGGAGDDQLEGGTGSDIFVFAPGDSLGLGDVITDFTVTGRARDILRLRNFDFTLVRNADGTIATTLADLDAQGLKISDLMDADGDEGGTGGKDDREITLPDGGKITLLDVGSEALTIDNFIFDLF